MGRGGRIKELYYIYTCPKTGKEIEIPGRSGNPYFMMGCLSTHPHVESLNICKECDLYKTRKKGRFY